MVASVAPISSGGAGGSVEYYVDKVANDRHDYYAGHGEAPGTWRGEFAALLGLNGNVEREQFRSVLEGKHPETDVKLKPYVNSRVAAWDVTFSPPKSISALWALAPEEQRSEVRDAQAAAVDAGIGYLRDTACVARLGTGGKDRQDGSDLGFLRCDFTHRCSREGDPQLHTHTILANILQAPDGRRAALDGGLTHQHAKAADGIYQAALRAELTARLDVEWTRTDDDSPWEIAGIPPGLSRQWSQRRSQIEAALAARGLDGDRGSGRAAQTATLDTRQAKVKVADGELLHDRFHREAVDGGHDPNRILGDTIPHDRHETVTVEPDADARVLDLLVGPDGVTERASSFSRCEALADVANRRPLHARSAADAAAAVEHLTDRLVHDDRVIPVLAPAARTSGELLRVRDDTGRVVRTVDQSERRYTTIDLLTAEADLLARAQTRQHDGTALIPREAVERVLAEHPHLDADQQAMIRTLASDGAGVSVVVGKAGTGKSTALAGYRAALDQAGIPVLGVAPSATAAHQLARSAGIADAPTMDRLLVELEHGHRTLPAGAVVVLDEAGMCPTRTRLALQQAVDAVGGKIVDVGDHRQIPSVDVGGGHYALTQRLGASVLGENHRFKEPVYRDAAELLRDRQPGAAVELLRAQDAVNDAHDEPVGAWAAMVDDWLAHRDHGDDAMMLATERATVAQLNQLARAHLQARGDITGKTKMYRSADDARRIGVAVGDEIILRRNDAQLAQPDRTTMAVRNGMTGRVVDTGRRGVTVELDDAHRSGDGPAEVTLPGGYVGEHVDHGYARTVDTAQGATVDHSLFAPSASTSAERAYVALSRGRETNRIYATRDRAWIDAIGDPRGHTLATDQQPAHSVHNVNAARLPDDLAARHTALHNAITRRDRTGQHEATRDLRDVSDVGWHAPDQTAQQPSDEHTPTPDRPSGQTRDLYVDRLPDDLAARRDALHAALAREQNDRGQPAVERPPRQRPGDAADRVTAAANPKDAVTETHHTPRRPADDHPHGEDRRAEHTAHGLDTDRLPDDLAGRREALHAALAQEQHDRRQSDKDQQMWPQRRDDGEPVVASKRTPQPAPDVAEQHRDNQADHQPPRPATRTRGGDRGDGADPPSPEPDRDHDARHDRSGATPETAHDRDTGIAM